MGAPRFGDLVRTARVAKGWTQGELAEAAGGISATLISKLETGATGSSTYEDAIRNALDLPRRPEADTAGAGPTRPAGEYEAALLAAPAGAVGTTVSVLQRPRIRAALAASPFSDLAEFRSWAENEWRDATGLCRSWHHDLFVALVRRGTTTETDLRHAIEAYWIGTRQEFANGDAEGAEGVPSPRA